VEKGCLEFVSILLIELLFVLGGLVGLFTAILFHCRRRAGPGSIDFVTNFKNPMTFGLDPVGAGFLRFRAFAHVPGISLNRAPWLGDRGTVTAEAWEQTMIKIQPFTSDVEQGERLLHDDEVDAVSGGIVSGGEKTKYMEVKLTDVLISSF